MIRQILGLTLAALLLLPRASLAQFSDSYNFLKAVRERDINKANDYLSKPGTVIVDTRDQTTGDSALHIVTRAKDLPWVNYILQKGGKPDIKDRAGNTPLIVAASTRFIEGATALIRGRAQVNLANGSGETPLIRAVQIRDAAMVRLLLNNGANPDKADSLAGLSARDYAKRDPRNAAILKIIEEPRAKPAATVGPKL
jgi:uncharacterized protein